MSWPPYEQDYGPPPPPPPPGHWFAQGYAPPPQDYPPPPQGYSPPPQDYTVPSQGYAVSSQGYAAPSQGYAAPSQRFAAPPQSYAPTAQGYTTPPQGYAPPHDYWKAGTQPGFYYYTEDAAHEDEDYAHEAPAPPDHERQPHPQLGLQLRQALAHHQLEHLYPTLAHHGYGTLTSLVRLRKEQLLAFGVHPEDAEVVVKTFGQAKSSLSQGAGAPPPPPPPVPAEGSSSPSQPAQGRELPRQKRRYNRQPKADANAPIRPQTAYIQFTSEVRAELRAQGRGNMSFSDVAKLTGERWGQLPWDVKQARETAAAQAKQEYQVAMDAYQQSEEYAVYADYLVKFNAEQERKAEQKASSSGSRGGSGHP